MRLALIGPVYPYRGGIAHYTTALYRALREKGHEVLLVSFSRQYPQWLFPGKSDRDPSRNPLKVEEAHYWLDSLNPLTWLRTFARIRRAGPEIMVMQWWTSFWAPAWFALGLLNRLFLRTSIVYFCHNVLPHEARWWDSWLARATLRWATLFLVQSGEEETRLRGLLPQAEIRVVPLPVFDMFSDLRIARDEARQRLDLPADALVLLSFGIVREYKGLRVLLEAIPGIRAAASRSVVLVVAGEFWEDKQPYLDLIEHLRIGDSVRVDDRYIPDEEVPAYFCAADALAAPYRQVTGSAVTRIADSFGLPVIHDLADAAAIVSRLEAGDAVPPALPVAAPQPEARGGSDRGMEEWVRAPAPTWQGLVEQIETAARMPIPADRTRGDTSDSGR